MRSITLPDGSQWTMETLNDAAPAADGGANRRARVSRVRSYVWVRCVGDHVERRFMFASAWELWPERQLADALADALRPRSSGREADGTAGALAFG